MKELYLLKIGGSVITDLAKPNTALVPKIKELLSEIRDAKASGAFDIIIGHDSGSFGHVVAKQYRTNEGFVNEQSRFWAALTHLAAKELNHIFIREGLDLGISVYPFSPGHFSLADNGKLQEGFAEQLRLAIENGFIPVVHRDVVMDKELGVSIASTEEVLRFVSQKLEPSKVFFATDVVL